MAGTGESGTRVGGSDVPGRDLVEDGSTMLVPFSLASPFHDAKEQSKRLFDYGGRLVTIFQRWQERRVMPAGAGAGTECMGAGAGARAGAGDAGVGAGVDAGAGAGVGAGAGTGCLAAGAGARAGAGAGAGVGAGVGGGADPCSRASAGGVAADADAGADGSGEDGACASAGAGTGTAGTGVGARAVAEGGGEGRQSAHACAACTAGDSTGQDGGCGGGVPHTEPHGIDTSGTGEGLGFGASLYHSAVVLAEYIHMHPEVVHGKVCVELGAGAGLVSIVAALAGARKVYVTDGNADLLKLTQQNVDYNLSTDPQLHERVVVCHHLWGDFDAKDDAQRDMLAAAPVDVVLGADIAACPYAPALRDLVVSCERLAGASTLVLIGYQARNAVEQLFFKRMRRAFAGAVPVPRDQLHPDFQADNTLQLLQFHKRPPA